MQYIVEVTVSTFLAEIDLGVLCRCIMYLGTFEE